MAPPQQLRQQTSNCSLLLIYRPRKDERLSWPGWLTYSGWFTHLSSHPAWHVWLRAMYYRRQRTVQSLNGIWRRRAREQTKGQVHERDSCGMAKVHKICKIWSDCWFWKQKSICAFDIWCIDIYIYMMFWCMLLHRTFTYNNILIYIKLQQRYVYLSSCSTWECKTSTLL